MNQPDVPITVLGGALGAGKTTIVNHLLRNADRRLAVLVNDFGSVNLDAALISSQSDDVIELTNGCICCAIADGLVMSLMDILDRPERPDHLLIETSGVANPATVANYAGLPGFTRDGTLVAVDGEQFLDQLDDPYIGDMVLAQVQAADVILLTKADLVGDLEPIIDRLTRISPQAPILAITDGAVDNSIAYGPTLVEPAGADSVELDATTEHRSMPAWDRARIERWLDQAPAGVLRVKGISGKRPDALRFDRVGQRRTVAPSDVDATGVVVAITRPETDLAAWFDELSTS